MPTGYTADVQSGKVTEFKDFAMQCARAFGALIEMRDEPSNAEIPDEFKPSDYHKKALKNAVIELSRLKSLTKEGASVERDVEEAKRIERRTSREDERVEQKRRYQEMLHKVNTWSPPSGEHVEMKNFMQDQLLKSIDFDCSPSSYDESPIPDAAEWLSDAIKEAENSVKYHKEQYDKEIDRTNKRNEWIRLLRGSLE